jgi:hypothetical protein
MNINIKTIIDNTPTIIYRNNIFSSFITFQNNIIQKYVPRILANITKYNVLKMLLSELGINHHWLLMLLLAII